MKRVILLGAISSFCDLIREMEALDIEPIVCDYYVDAPAKKMGYSSFDVSTTDIEQLKKIVDENSIDGVISAFSDRNLIPALSLCEYVGSNYYFNEKIISCLTDKQLMKAFFNRIEVPVVKYGIINIHNLEEGLNNYSYPVVTKPLDAYGSKGIFVCNNFDDVKAACTKTIKESLKYSEEIIVEEFYRADEISVTAWVRGGIAYITCIYDVFRNTADDITLAAVSFPSKYTAKYLKQFDTLLNYIVSNCEIDNGPVTLQCFIGREGLKISELLCRLAGGSPYLYSVYMGGPNIAKMLIQYAVNEKVDYQNLDSFKPILYDDVIYYDIQVLIGVKGIIVYDFDEEEIMRKIPEIVDIRIYYPKYSEIINVGKNGVQFAKAICRTERNADYYELIHRVGDTIKVYNEAGDRISFIREPERLNVTRINQVDWGFLVKE